MSAEKSTIKQVGAPSMKRKIVLSRSQQSLQSMAREEKQKEIAVLGASE